MQQVSQTCNGLCRAIPVWVVYLLGFAPFVWLLIQLFTYQLGVDPVKVLEHEFGKVGLQFIVGGIVITPLRNWTGINLLKFRRAIGVLAFFYVLAHLLVWLVLDIQLLWGEILTDIFKRPYITIGMFGFLIMAPLALTSNNTSVKKMGAMSWRKLHKLTYLAAPAAAIHYVMVVKGWQIEPLIYLAIVGVLLIARIKLKQRNRSAARV
ncbi:protein-methionine-sulfoxide reductase heme-binding subunit MsrQ [Cochlodiniinecator piscidefendens]|uniref:protein-methionine-sulfoxide reductase heme-binding subunit MsrQ n=1 Tax=Cochlodiniinecator piscidefendens TaxID=2715756 RepID=UPI00140A0301|nr:protein-methionine-sulfoxide reductase heme-binding subunit MsrQ [Cochlodiniinecator piscidefendens]